MTRIADTLRPESARSSMAKLVLDEIQIVPGWEVFTRRLLETEKMDLLLSGSSARLLSREVATSVNKFRGDLRLQNIPLFFIQPVGAM